LSGRQLLVYNPSKPLPRISHSGVFILFGKKKSQVSGASRKRGLDLYEVVGLFFSFVWFHRGVLLFGLVLWGLYHVLTMASDKVSETKRRDAEAPAFVYVPRPVEVERPREVDPSAQSVSLPTDPVPVVRQPNKKVVVPKGNPEEIRFQKFLATGTVDSLTRRFKILMQEVPLVSAFQAVTNIKKCQSICGRMREMELSQEQQSDLVILELEAMSQFDAISTQHAMDIPGVRDRLMILATSLLEHPEDEVSSKSHLAIFAAVAMDLIVAPTREGLDSLATVYQTHVDGVLRFDATAIVMSQLLEEIIKRHQFDEVIVLRRDMADRIFDSGLIDFDDLGVTLRERLIFGDLRPMSLISRVDGLSETAAEDVGLFCQRLERFPDTRKEVYQVALDVIDKYVVQERFDQASSLLRALQEIKNTIPNPKTKAWLGESILVYAEKISLAQTPR